MFTTDNWFDPMGYGQWGYIIFAINVAQIDDNKQLKNSTETKKKH